MSFALYMVMREVVAAGMMMMGVRDTATRETPTRFLNAATKSASPPFVPPFGAAQLH